jgi:hypothetical protein
VKLRERMLLKSMERRTSLVKLSITDGVWKTTSLGVMNWLTFLMEAKSGGKTSSCGTEK